MRLLLVILASLVASSPALARNTESKNAKADRHRERNLHANPGSGVSLWKTPKSTSPVIVGGRDTQDNGPPGMCFVVSTDKAGKKSVCSATMTRNGCFFLAGHCVMNPQGKAEIYFGKSPNTSVPGIPVDGEIAVKGRGTGDDLAIGRVQLPTLDTEALDHPNRQLSDDLDKALCNLEEQASLEPENNRFRKAAVWGYGATASVLQPDGTYKNTEGVGRLRDGTRKIDGVGVIEPVVVGDRATLRFNRGAKAGTRMIVTHTDEDDTAKINGGDSGGGLWVRVGGLLKVCGVLSQGLRVTPGFFRNTVQAVLNEQKKFGNDPNRMNAEWEQYASYTSLADNREWMDEQWKKQRCNTAPKSLNRESEASKERLNRIRKTKDEIIDIVETFHSFDKKFSVDAYATWKRNNSEEPLQKLLLSAMGIDADRKDITFEVSGDRERNSVQITVNAGEEKWVFHVGKENGKTVSYFIDPKGRLHHDQGITEAQ